LRKLLIAAVALGGLASIALCASYGWDQATELKDQITQAFVYGMVALFTLLLHFAAIKAWSNDWRKAGFVIGFGGFLAFVMTAFTSLGGMAMRSDVTIAGRQVALDTKVDTKRQVDELVAEKTGMKFVRTTQATVDAAKLVAAAATKAREQECGKVGEHCRKRQDAENAALTAYAEARENKASTDRYDKIEVE
jgi:hypothetical protein